MLELTTIMKMVENLYLNQVKGPSKLYLQITQQVYRHRSKNKDFDEFYQKYHLKHIEKMLCNYVLMCFGIFFHVMTWQRIVLTFKATYGLPFALLYAANIAIVQMGILNIKKSTKIFHSQSLHDAICILNINFQQSNYKYFFFHYKNRTQQMPKAIDIYILEKKIGSGQFGDVFKGQSKVDGNQVAIKCINRSKVVGKFTQLLESQIRVLRSCQNNNIIKLIDIKKTANNIYLIMQYCNDGDLSIYLKSKRKLCEDQAVQYFVQILHAFETLVKNKVMHRDFKLANVLKNNGVIKIADFGFAKLLKTQDQQVETILGSPLNMAPQVLNKQIYNNKADIWSIGVALYQMIYGKVPFMANNIIDLVKTIHKQPLLFPFKTAQVIEDCLQKMLTVDPQKRIEWKDLFEHPINSYLQGKLSKSLQSSMLCEKQNLRYNLSKFYIKTNKLISNPYEIQAKEELNSHVKQIIKNEKPSFFKGLLIKRNKKRQNKYSFNPVSMDIKGTQKVINQLETQCDTSQIKLNTLSYAEKRRIFRNNWDIILFHRNLYAFLGNLAQQALQKNYNIYGECLAFVVLKKILGKMDNLIKSLHNKSVEGVQLWQEYEQTEQHKKILKLIQEQHEIYSKLTQKVSLKVLQKDTLSHFDQDLMISGKYTYEETQKIIYKNVTIKYIQRIINVVCKRQEKLQRLKHIQKAIDSFNCQQVFKISSDFQGYYNQEQKQQNDVTELMQKYENFIEKI